MTLKLDATQLSVVATCTDCPWWRGFGFDRLDGWATSARHEAEWHPGQDQARKSLRMAQERTQALLEA